MSRGLFFSGHSVCLRLIGAYSYFGNHSCDRLTMIVKQYNNNIVDFDGLSRTYRPVHTGVKKIEAKRRVCQLHRPCRADGRKAERSVGHEGL